jgi:glycerol-3-phosphate acyltransferase PlsY
MDWRFTAFIAAYVIGSIPFGYITGYLKGVDVREFGSGNIGATHVFRILGPIAFLVLVLDLGKGAAAAYLGTLFFAGQPVLVVLTGLMAVVGHNWSVFLKFEGGKGVATTVGIFLYLMPVLTAVAIGLFLLVVAISRYVSLGSLALAATLAVGSLVIDVPVAYQGVAWLAAVFVFYQHRGNIQRLLSGTESRFGERVEVSAGEADSS